MIRNSATILEYCADSTHIAGLHLLVSDQKLYVYYKNFFEKFFDFSKGAHPRNMKFLAFKAIFKIQQKGLQENLQSDGFLCFFICRALMLKLINCY